MLPFNISIAITPSYIMGIVCLIMGVINMYLTIDFDRHNMRDGFEIFFGMQILFWFFLAFIHIKERFKLNNVYKSK